MNKRQRLTAALVSKTGRNADSTVREKVFRCVANASKNAPHSVPQMVARLGKQGHEVSAVTVNNHLRALSRLGICEVVGKAPAEGRGRPAAIWGLTEAGQGVAELR